MSFICCHCILDSHVREAPYDDPRKCDYCGVEDLGMEVLDVAYDCLRVLREHFETTHTSPYVILQHRPPEGLSLMDTLRQLNVVQDAALPDLVAETLQCWRYEVSQDASKHVEDSADPWFRLHSGQHFEVSRKWREMELSLRQEARYVNRKAIAVLDDVFADLHSSSTDGGTPLIVYAGPGKAISSLTRARVFQTEQALQSALAHPARNLGTPPAGVSQAGRMNAKGQPAFYGATAVEVAVAEVRPPVGSWVVTAEFELTRIVSLLDLSALAEIQLGPQQSLFNPDSIAQVGRRDFLRTLAKRLIQPVMPELQEHDYLVTQVIADYLSDRDDGPIGGILYPSAQVHGAETGHGRNVVLFPRAAQVEGADEPFEAEVVIWDLEIQQNVATLGFHPGIRLPDPPPPESSHDGHFSAEPPLPQLLPSLRIDLASMCVHEVKGVVVATKAVPVDVLPKAGEGISLTSLLV
ncbi:RES family NAD+ phosphorylase [Paucibacter sp. R3-3]|uniref:RES family NAD+ phosphorylase n=1 Tax=Roseateles agri TaxID=3098619 RepID=A0ABU5DI66_9BURK|nr:RES family NAD+ phosphorylase [Paucibacter sp. R3-3]MDY0744807.1 RES family NAD+ phosphorylase [Paucibacter sp. R3-3]